MTRVDAPLAALGAASLLAGCATTQDKAAKVRAEGLKGLSQRHGLVIGRSNPDVQVLAKAILHDVNGTAAVLELRSRAKKPLAAVPIAISLNDASGRKVFANDAPGLAPSLVQVALLKAGKPTIWVHDQITATSKPMELQVRVGAPRGGAVPAQVPHITLSHVGLKADSSGPYASGVVRNRSSVTQRRLTISCVAANGSRVVAAGRGIVDRLVPYPTPKPVRFSVYFIGNPKGARLTCSVPPVNLR